MDQRMLFALLFALIWGCVWAMFLQWTRLGKFLVHQRTWITVVIGMGGDLAIVGLCVPFDVWVKVAAIIAVSSVGIIARSLLNEWGDVQQLKRAMNVESDEISQ